MKKLRVLVIILIFTLMVFVGGTFYGFKEGMNNFSLLEQVVQGALSRHQLAAIEKNKIESVQHLLELNIDSGLHRYVMYKNDGNKLLSNYFMPTHTSELERYVDLMVEYRKDHPIVFNPNWANSIEGDDEETKLWREQGYNENNEMLSVIKSLLRERGVPE